MDALLGPFTLAFTIKLKMTFSSKILSVEITIEQFE